MPTSIPESGKTVPLTVHISASIGYNNQDYELGSVEVDYPIEFQTITTIDGTPQVTVKTKPKEVTTRLLKACDAFAEALDQHHAQ